MFSKQHIIRECEQGRLMNLLEQIPRDKWKSEVEESCILYFAPLGNNVKAIIELVKEGCSLTNRPIVRANYTHLFFEMSPMHKAFIRNDVPRSMIELFLLLCENSDFITLPITARVKQKRIRMTLFECTITISLYDTGSKVLIANGYRLKSVSTQFRKHITLGMWAFEQGVLRCRDVIVTLLGLKRRRRGQVFLPKLDRFLLQEVLAVEIWTTRSTEEWQPSLDGDFNQVTFPN